LNGPAGIGPAGHEPADTVWDLPAVRDPLLQPQWPRRRWGRKLTGTLIAVLVAALAVGVIRTFAIETFFVPSPSMVPTIQVNDRIIVQKAFFNWHDVRQGEIVVFTEPPLADAVCGGTDDGNDLVKRVIALPGQTIYSSGSNIYVDGKLLSEPYLPKNDTLGKPIPDASEQHPYKVPAGEFYMMGDNRAISCDSRFWGPIEGSTIVGRAIVVSWQDNHLYFHPL
jgi:signal peptidase I